MTAYKTSLIPVSAEEIKRCIHQRAFNVQIITNFDQSWSTATIRSELRTNDAYHEGFYTVDKNIGILLFPYSRWD